MFLTTHDPDVELLALRLERLRGLLSRAYDIFYEAASGLGPEAGTSLEDVTIPELETAYRETHDAMIRRATGDAKDKGAFKVVRMKGEVPDDAGV